MWIDLSEEDAFVPESSYLHLTTRRLQFAHGSSPVHLILLVRHGMHLESIHVRSGFADDCGESYAFVVRLIFLLPPSIFEARSKRGLLDSKQDNGSLFDAEE